LCKPRPYMHLVMRKRTRGSGPVLVRAIGVSMVLLLAVVNLPAGADTATPKHIQLCVWYNGPAANLQAIHDIMWMYQQYHRDVLVHLTVRDPALAYESMVKWCGKEAKSAPDMVVIPDLWLPQFAEYLQPMDEVVRPERLREICSAVLNQLTVGGVLRAVPWRVDARVIYIRRDLREAKQAERPESWAEVAKLAAELHDPPKVYGIGLPGSAQGDGAAALLDIVWALGGTVVDADGKISLKEEKLAEALSSYLEVARAAGQPEVLTWSQAELEGLFVAGRLGCVITDTGFTQRLAQSGVEMEYEICPFAKDGEGSGDVTVQGLAIFRSSAVLEECKQFADLVCGQRCQKLLSTLGGVPANLSLIKRWKQNQRQRRLVANVERGFGLPPEAWPRLRGALGAALYAVLSGRQLPEAAARQAVELLGVEGGEQ